MKTKEQTLESEQHLSVNEWQLITNSINAYMISESVYAACELDVFQKIEHLDCPDLENIAKSIKLTEYTCSILLMCLCCSNLIQKDEATGLYSNHSASRKALCSDAINSFIPFVRFNHDVQQKGMSFFLDSLKTEKNEGLSFLPGNSSILYDRLSESSGMTKLFHEGMAAYTHSGPKIVSFQEMSNSKLLLDIGGGNGSVSKKYLAEYPLLNAVVLDLKSVCDIGRESNLDIKERLTFVASDLFTDEWDFGQDSILFSHLLEIFSLESVARLYKKAYESLPDRGKLFVWTIISNDNETGSLQAAKSSAYFLTLASGAGKTYSKKTHIKLCKSAGFQIKAIYDQSGYDHLGLVAVK